MTGTLTLTLDGTGVWLLDTVAVGPWSVDLLVVLAFALLVAGVVGSVTPVVPAGLLSLAGVLTYWWTTGEPGNRLATGEPGILILSGLVLLALLALAADWFAGVIAAKAGGASTRTTIVATVVGLLGLAVAGPLGFILGTAGMVFGLELTKSGDVGHSARAAGVTLLGMLGSSVAQLLLTASVLLVMVVVALV